MLFVKKTTFVFVGFNLRTNDLDHASYFKKRDLYKIHSKYSG